MHLTDPVRIKLPGRYGIKPTRYYLTDASY